MFLWSCSRLRYNADVVYRPYFPSSSFFYSFIDHITVITFTLLKAVEYSLKNLYLWKKKTNMKKFEKRLY